jgi:hypothetical protein
MNSGTPLKSIANGIAHVRNYGNVNAGKTILIEDENGRTFIYGHLSQFKVHEGQHVHKGDLIGLSGNTGHSSGSHLHFGMKENGHFVDPSAYVPQIQHMNDSISPVPITQHATQLADSEFSFHDLINGQMNVYSDLFHNFKLNIINLITSVDYSIVIEHFQHLLNFFFG